jgi:hypothetical protein
MGLCIASYCHTWRFGPLQANVHTTAHTTDKVHYIMVYNTITGYILLNAKIKGIPIHVALMGEQVTLFYSTDEMSQFAVRHTA